MALNHYSFTTIWLMDASQDEVMKILDDASGLARWWPSVYLKIEELPKALSSDADQADALTTESTADRSSESKIGRKIRLYTKGWLPYTLKWDAVVTEVRPDGWRLKATGDFEGEGNWTFAPRGNQTEVRYDWIIVANKPLLKWLSPVFKPIFAANHRWAMGMGEHSLKLEILRQRQKQRTDGRPGGNIPLPPMPRFNSLYVLISTAILAVTGIVTITYLARQK